MFAKKDHKKKENTKILEHCDKIMFCNRPSTLLKYAILYNNREG